MGYRFWDIQATGRQKISRSTSREGKDQATVIGAPSNILGVRARLEQCASPRRSDVEIREKRLISPTGAIPRQSTRNSGLLRRDHPRFERSALCIISHENNEMCDGNGVGRARALPKRRNNLE